jgi:hypothetical protein
VQAHARALLQVANHAEQILGLRIAARAEHADKALGRRAGRRAEFFKTDRRLDVVAQDDLAGFNVTGEHRIDAFAQKGFGEFLVTLDVVLDQTLFTQAPSAVRGRQCAPPV